MSVNKKDTWFNTALTKYHVRVIDKPYKYVIFG